MRKTIFLYLSLILMYSTNLVKPECCELPYLHLFGRTCADGRFIKKDHIYCGIGSCNVFGCNCDGGCVTPDTNWSPGDIIGCRRTMGLIGFIHVFILGYENMIYDAQPNAIRKIPLSEELDKGRECTTITSLMCEYGTSRGWLSSCYNTNITSMFRKLDMLANDYWDYDFLTNNCEHFVTKYRFGVKYSPQAL